MGRLLTTSRVITHARMRKAHARKRFIRGNRSRGPTPETVELPGVAQQRLDAQATLSITFPPGEEAVLRHVIPADPRQRRPCRAAITPMPGDDLSEVIEVKAVG